MHDDQAVGVRVRALLLELVDEALVAVEPERVVRHALRELQVRPTAVVATGKAAPAMARGAAAALGGIEGIVVSDHAETVPGDMDLMVAGHPVPNEASLVAGLSVLDLADGLEGGDQLLYLLSGGTSALVEVPCEPISLPDLVAMTEILLRCGASIHEVNTVRISLSEMKGGGLLKAAAPASITTLAISDVVGDDPALIGSGPSVPGARTAADAIAIIERYDLSGKAPPNLRTHLENARADRGTEGVGRGDYRIVANGAMAAAAVVEGGLRRGLRVRTATVALEGEARTQATAAIERARSSDSADVWVFAGETTVTVRGDGIGGRNQEAALAAAMHLAGSDDVTFLAFGTDGIDGPTIAAGGIVDGTTVNEAGVRYLDPTDHLERNDSASWLSAAGAQVVTGPTGTNVGDLWIVARRSAGHQTPWCR